MLLKDFLYINSINQTEFAKQVRIGRSNFNNCLNGHRRFKPEHALKIEKLTKGEVSRDEVLFPELNHRKKLK